MQYFIEPAPYHFEEFSDEYKTLVFESEGGSEQRRRFRPVKRRSYSLSYELMKEDLDIIRAFFASKYGMAEGFTFNPYYFDDTLENEDINVRFTIDKLQVARVREVGGKIYKLKLDMIEVL